MLTTKVLWSNVRACRPFGTPIVKVSLYSAAKEFFAVKTGQWRSLACRRLRVRMRNIVAQSKGFVGPQPAVIRNMYQKQATAVSLPYNMPVGVTAVTLMASLSHPLLSNYLECRTALHQQRSSRIEVRRSMIYILLKSPFFYRDSFPQPYVG